jgi:hypothetical protein
MRAMGENIEKIPLKATLAVAFTSPPKTGTLFALPPIWSMEFTLRAME